MVFIAYIYELAVSLTDDTKRTNNDNKIDTSN